MPFKFPNADAVFQLFTFKPKTHYSLNNNLIINLESTYTPVTTFYDTLLIVTLKCVYLTYRDILHVERNIRKSNMKKVKHTLLLKHYLTSIVDHFSPELQYFIMSSLHQKFICTLLKRTLTPPSITSSICTSPCNLFK